MRLVFDGIFSFRVFVFVCVSLYVYINTAR